MSAREVRTFEAEVPKNAQEGETFVAIGPEGQRVDVVVPKGAVAGDRVTAVIAPHASYDAQPAAPAPIVMGVPLGVAAAHYDLEAAQYAKEERAAQAGTTMYALGWCICCFLGPFGPLFWFFTWVRHRARPRDERENYPRERFVARLSCATGLMAVTAHFVLVIAAVAYLRHEGASCSNVLERSMCLQTPSHILPTGTEFIAHCPADCGPARCYDSLVWGGANGFYAGGSAICGAALQAGVVQEGVGGDVLVETTPGYFNYIGIKRNGIGSRSVPGIVRQSFVVHAPSPDQAGNATADANRTATINGTATGNATAAGDTAVGNSAAAAATIDGNATATGDTASGNSAAASATIDGNATAAEATAIGSSSDAASTTDGAAATTAAAATSTTAEAPSTTLRPEAR